MARVFRELLEAIILALIVFMVIQGSVRNFRVEGSSMHPTLVDDEYLLVNKLVYFNVDTYRLSRLIPFWKVDKSADRFAARGPERGEVIVFKYPRDESKDFVKRVIGLPGEHVEVRDGNIYIEGELLPEPHINAGGVACDGGWCDYTLKASEYYVVGDNRCAGCSNDSRHWGPVPEKNVLGKVWFVYWPFSGFDLLDSVSSRAQGALRQLPWP